LGVSVILSYLISQILFGVIIMDYMSQITEKMVTGREKIPENITILKRFFHLVKQEIPRTTLPVLLSLMLMVLSWFTPLGPLMAIITSGISVIFLSWDNTDLIPARRLDPFKKRFKHLLKTLPFHLGFGLLFLLPGLSIIFLSFAPVGATLYYTDSEAWKSEEKPRIK
jgi:CysZ protein